MGSQPIHFGLAISMLPKILRVWQMHSESLFQNFVSALIVANPIGY